MGFRLGLIVFGGLFVVLVKQMDSPPVFVDATEYSAGLVRRILSRMVGSVTGMFGVSDFVVTLTGSDLTVASGRAAIPAPPQESGVYFVESTQVTSLTLDPADNTRDRIDRLVAYVVPPATASESGRWFLEVRKGAPAAVPTGPNVDNCYLIAEFSIPAASKGTAPSVFDRRYSSGQQYISGPTLYGAERPGIQRPGQLWTDSATRETWIYVGGAWARLGGVPVVSQTSEVIAPFVGHIVYDKTTGTLKRYTGTGYDELGTTVPKGRRWRTAAFHTLTTTNAVVPMQGSRVQGGMTTSANGLIVPRDGLYRIWLLGYATGGPAWRIGFAVHRIRSGGTPDAEVLWASMWKSGAADYSITANEDVPLKAGDEIRLSCAAQPADSTTATWGVGEYSGTRFSVEFLHSLPAGQNPI
ncbi:hypothetical protein JOD54_001098 [Actinokineospora baliensis]|uniref:hypothetical protein n=1 Tax=Actinokineospora baliensis TaxID=547056 RepID=UPI00195DF325|nr:hypothetical protein [Actinokineospora baliensis]MBM7770894.1 hypothetical protein [Actinokineospora baliensis]